MTEFSQKTSATIAFAADEATAFYALPAIVGSLLAQTGATITKLDLALSGDSIGYVTDHGEIELLGRLHDDGAWQVTVTCDTPVNGTRETGRQLCFQIVRRLISRLSVSSVFWQPTRQRMTPDRFTWQALADAPQRSGHVVVPAHESSALT